jgi:hypothetical protein
MEFLVKKIKKLKPDNQNNDLIQQVCAFKPKDLERYVNSLRDYLDDETLLLQEGITSDEKKSIQDEIDYWEKNVLSVLKRLNLL